MRDEFWRTKSLAEMTSEEWESLCDGCGQCCQVKLEDADTGDIAVTDVACQLLDTDSCRCTHYPERHIRVPDCIPFNSDTIGETLPWLPATCAYRLVGEGRPLPQWHPLITGDPDSVHAAGISVRHRVISEASVAESDLEHHVLHWVGTAPARPAAGTQTVDRPEEN